MSRKVVDRGLLDKGRSEGTLTPSQLSRYHNTKYPKKKVLYKGRDTDFLPIIPIDIRHFVCPADYSIKSFLKEVPYRSKHSYDHRASVIHSSIHKGFVHNTPSEYLQFPYETLSVGSGGYFDISCLVATCLIASGIPEFRVRVVVGMAYGDVHTYCTYLRQFDDQWVIIDCSDEQDANTAVYKKPLIDGNSMYGEVIFSFNNKYSWANKVIKFSDISHLG